MTLLTGGNDIQAAVVNAGVVASCKKLQPHRERLLLDTLALTTGLRAALLLDYAPSAPVSAIESLCKALSDSLSLHIVAWHWQGCLWVVSHHQLEARLKAILDPQEYTEYVNQLLKLMHQHNGASACEGSVGDSGQKGHSRHLLRVPDEGALDGILPFVNGVLLGYPFVYCVSAETVNRACTWLSTTELLLCGFTGEPKQTADWLKGHHNKASRICQNELWKCSVPLETTDAAGKVVDVQSLWAQWASSKIQSAGELIGWESVRPFTRQVAMQAIVL